MEGILISRPQIDTFENIDFTSNRPVFTICILAITVKLRAHGRSRVNKAGQTEHPYGVWVASMTHTVPTSYMDLEYNLDEYRFSLYGTKDVLSTGVVSSFSGRFTEGLEQQ